MKKYKIAIVLIMLLMFTGCNEYGEKRIVKLLTINEENITLYYYDYSKDKPVYLTETMVNTGIENTLTDLLSIAEYDLKLCEYAVCSEDVIENNMTELFEGLINSKFSPCIVVVEGKITGDDEKYIDIEKKNYPLYTAHMTEAGVTSIVENADNYEKKIITDGVLYKTLYQQESFVLDVLGGKIKQGTYIFESAGKKYAVKLENIKLNYSFDGNNLNLKIDAVLKSYKGLSSNKEDKKLISEMAERSIKKNADNIFNDALLTDKFKLLWYKAINDVNQINVSVNIK